MELCKFCLKSQETIEFNEVPVINNAFDILETNLLITTQGIHWKSRDLIYLIGLK